MNNIDYEMIHYVSKRFGSNFYLLHLNANLINIVWRQFLSKIVDESN